MLKSEAAQSYLARLVLGISVPTSAAAIRTLARAFRSWAQAHALRRHISGYVCTLVPPFLPGLMPLRLYLLCGSAPLRPPASAALSRSSSRPSQSRILYSLSISSSTRPTPVRRSPRNWSHIVHHIRNPTTLSAHPAIMATQNSLDQAQSRSHSHHGHSHGHHHHHHDNTYLTSKNKSDPGVRITRIGLYVNLGMAIAKGAGGYVFNSQA